MANINAPRGLKPSRDVAGRPFNEQLTPYRLASGYATNLFVGDPVKLVAGYIQKAGPADQIIGVVQAFQWTGADGMPRPSQAGGQYWPAGTVTMANADATALVLDNQDTLFEAVFTNSAAIPVKADVGKYFRTFDAGGNTATGLSGIGIDYSTATTTSANGVYRFVDFVQRQDNDPTTAYSRGLFVPTFDTQRINSGAA